MLQSQAFIVQKLQEIKELSVLIYQGELENPTAASITGRLPMALVDFTSDRSLSSLECELEFLIYIVNTTQGIHDTHASRDKTLTLIESINQKLSMTQTPSGGVLKLGSLRKIFDTKSPKGYMTIFTRQVLIKTHRHHHLEEEN